MKNVMRFIIISAVFIAVPLSGLVCAYEYKGIDIRGFVSQGYLKTSNNNFFANTEDGTTQFDEAAINFSADVSDKLRVGLQFLARDFGTIGNNEVLLDWAIADYHWNDWMGFMVGNMKFVHGLYNETRDIDMLRTWIFLPQSVYNEGWRESISSIQGASVYGDVPLGDMGSLNYDVQYGTINLSPDKGAARLLEDQWPFTYYGMYFDTEKIDVDYTYTGSLKWITNVEGLIVGGSSWKYKFTADGSTTLDTTNAQGAGIVHLLTPGLDGTLQLLDDYGGRIELSPTKFEAIATTYVGSVEYTWRSLVFAAEYMRTNYDLSFKNAPLFNTLSPVLAAAGTTVESDGKIKVEKFSAEGYYGSLAYRFTPWFELGSYYSVYYANTDDRDGSERVARHLDNPDEKYRAWLKDITLTTRFDVTENWIFKLEGHRMNGAAILLGADNPAPDDPNEKRYEKNWYLYAAKVTYNF